MRFLIAVLLYSSVYSNNLIDEKADQSVRDSYFYGSFNLGPAPFPLPGLGLGYRVQNNHFGLDTHVQATSIILAGAVKIQSQALYYFKPNLKSQCYMGLGGSYTKLFNSHSLGSLTSPEFTFGKSYLNKNDSKRHFEVQISWPVFLHEEKTHMTYFPLCVFSYAIGF